MGNELFDQEKAVIDAAEDKLASGQIDAEVFGTLLKAYKKLSKTSRRLVRISDRNQHDLQIARKDAEAATRSKAAFLATMSHEIRTPMNGVIGMIDLLWQTDLHGEQKEMLGTVRDSAFSLLTIINDILDSSKIEAGKMELESVPLSVRDIVESVGDTLVANASAKGLEIGVYIDPAIPDSVLGDPVRIRQILLNLASNAVKFTEKTDGPEDGDHNRIILKAMRQDKTAEAGTAMISLSVTDQGIGLSPNALNNLFKPFTQADSSTTRRFGGTGLGLSICKSLSDLMNGTIGAESVEGSGSTFTLNIPLLIPANPETQTLPDIQDLPLKGCRVIVASIDDHTRQTISDYLTHWGAEIEITDNLLDAGFLLLSEAVNGSKFDIVILGDNWTDAERTEFFTNQLRNDSIPTPAAILLARQRKFGQNPPGVKSKWVRSAPLHRAKIVNSAAELMGITPPESSREEEQITIEAANYIMTVEEAEAAGCLILVADDNPTNLNVISRQLKVLGYAAETVEDGQQAFDALSRKQYGLLLTDCHMPNMDGYQLSQAIREKEKLTESDDLTTSNLRHLPIIAITASALQGEDQICYDAGMDGYLTKPLEMPKLKAELEKWLGNMQSSDPDSTFEPVGPTPSSSAISKSEAVDLSALISVFGDDPVTINEILKEFVGPATEIVDEIHTGYQNRNAGDISKAAHKLKSAARSIGANELADLCESLEIAGKTELWETLDADSPKIAPCFDIVLDFIDAL
jgi:signal transduction histidine kinase/CheY-like chemotaxis protein/HPt (histidine-containing phosphotransfer) domain-containing protein